MSQRQPPNPQESGQDDKKDDYKPDKPKYDDDKGYKPPEPGYEPPKPGYEPPKPGYEPPKPGYEPPKPSYGGGGDDYGHKGGYGGGGDDYGHKGGYGGGGDDYGKKDDYGHKGGYGGGGDDYGHKGGYGGGGDDYGKKDDYGHKDYGHKDYGHKDYGHKDYGHKDYGHKDYGHKDYGHKDYGHKEYGHKDYGHKDEYEKKDYGHHGGYEPPKPYCPPQPSCEDDCKPKDPCCEPEGCEQEQEYYGYKYKPTLCDCECFCAKTDAGKLREAMRGLGTDEKAIINVVACRTMKQREAIEKEYKQKFGRDLVEDLRKELGGHFEDVVLPMFYPRFERDARFLHHAVKGLGTDEECLIEILTTRSNYEIKCIKAVYKARYGKSLEDAIKDDTSGHFKRFLVILVQGNRNRCCNVDPCLVCSDAKALYQAGEKFWGTDEEMFNDIFANRSFPHLRAVFAEYKKITGKSIKTAISKEFSGDLEDGLRAIVDIAFYLPYYFARRLQCALDRPGTDDETLIRIVVTRCEIDMCLIKEEYKCITGRTLHSDIKDDTKGDYRRMLLRLIGE